MALALLLYFVGGDSMDSTNIAMARDPDCRPSIGRLSPREKEIVGLSDRGLTPKEIAFELGVSYATVRVLIARAMRKLGRAPR